MRSELEHRCKEAARRTIERIAARHPGAEIAEEKTAFVLTAADGRLARVGWEVTNA